MFLLHVSVVKTYPQAFHLIIHKLGHIGTANSVLMGSHITTANLCIWTARIFFVIKSAAWRCLLKKTNLQEYLK